MDKNMSEAEVRRKLLSDPEIRRRIRREARNNWAFVETKRGWEKKLRTQFLKPFGLLYASIVVLLWTTYGIGAVWVALHAMLIVAVIGTLGIVPLVGQAILLLWVTPGTPFRRGYFLGLDMNQDLAPSGNFGQLLLDFFGAPNFDSQRLYIALIACSIICSFLFSKMVTRAIAPAFLVGLSSRVRKVLTPITFFSYPAAMLVSGIILLWMMDRRPGDLIPNSREDILYGEHIAYWIGIILLVRELVVTNHFYTHFRTITEKTIQIYTDGAVQIVMDSLRSKHAESSSTMTVEPKTEASLQSFHDGAESSVIEPVLTTQPQTMRIAADRREPEMASQVRLLQSLQRRAASIASTTTTKICTSCGASTTIAAVFCWKCGASGSSADSPGGMIPPSRKKSVSNIRPADSD